MTWGQYIAVGAALAAIIALPIVGVVMAIVTGNESWLFLCLVLVFGAS